ncbi:MAG: LolA family protein [Polyangiaceae bacterium]
MRLSTWLTPFALAAVMAVATASHAQGAPSGPLPSVQQAVANVQNFYDHTQTFQSDFDQSYLAKAYNQTKQSTGHVTFSKPGKMEWVYNNPQGNRIVSDGTTIWVYDAGNKQVVQQNVAQSAMPSVLSFLSGQGRLDKDYDFQIVDGAQFNFPGGYVLVGTPKVANPSVVKVLFYVDKATSQIRRGMVIDGQGNRNSFTFKNPQVNTPVNPAQFKFVAPAGTTVVNPGNMPGNSGGAKP